MAGTFVIILLVFHKLMLYYVTSLHVFSCCPSFTFPPLPLHQVDGDLKQDGSTADMIFSIPYLISYISGIFRLEKGDLLLTGTPAGVGPVEPGQTITAGIEGVAEIKFPVVKRR